jgi:hypothetical protein
VLELPDRAAERMVLLAVLQRLLERGLGTNERHSADRDPLPRQGVHQCDDSAALFA